MNTYLSDSLGIRVDIRLDYGETLERWFRFYSSGTIENGAVTDGVFKDMTYWDAELRIFYKDRERLEEVFNLDNGKLEYISTGTYYVKQNLEIREGVWRYEFLLQRPDGAYVIPYKGQLIYGRDDYQ